MPEIHRKFLFFRQFRPINKAVLRIDTLDIVSNRMNTERPRWITYSPLTWYLPVLTLGHMDASGNSMARQVEKRIAVEHGREDDIRFCDLYSE